MDVELLPLATQAVEKYRIANRLSKTEMACALDVSRSRYSDLLSGARRLTIPMLKAAYKLGIPADELLS